jgi:hypothetical protein
MKEALPSTSFRPVYDFQADNSLLNKKEGCWGVDLRSWREQEVYAGNVFEMSLSS